VEIVCFFYPAERLNIFFSFKENIQLRIDVISTDYTIACNDMLEQNIREKVLHRPNFLICISVGRLPSLQIYWVVSFSICRSVGWLTFLLADLLGG
jgi:hypothetical protein